MCKVYSSLSLKPPTIFAACVFVCACTCFVSVQPVIIQSADAPCVFVVVCFLLATSPVSCLCNVLYIYTARLHSAAPAHFINGGFNLILHIVHIKSTITVFYLLVKYLYCCLALSSILSTHSNLVGHRKTDILNP